MVDDKTALCVSGITSVYIVLSSKGVIITRRAHINYYNDTHGLVMILIVSSLRTTLTTVTASSESTLFS